MIKSMTGYGESKNQNDYAHIHVEMSSLNSRFFEFHARTCRVLSIYDNEIKNKIKSNCIRGRFQLKTRIEFQNREEMSIDENKVKNYIDIASQIQKLNNNVSDKLSIDKLISMSDIYKIEDKNHTVIKSLYFECIDRAVLELNNSRINEGKNIGNGWSNPAHLR